MGACAKCIRCVASCRDCDRCVKCCRCVVDVDPERLKTGAEQAKAKIGRSLDDVERDLLRLRDERRVRPPDATLDLEREDQLGAGVEFGE